MATSSDVSPTPVSSAPQPDLFRLFLAALTDDGVLVRLSAGRWTVMDRNGEFVQRRKGEIPIIDSETLERWGCWPPTRWHALDSIAV